MITKQPLWSGTRTTEAQRGKSLHCTAKNSIPIPNFQVRPKHILSATFCKKSLRKNAMVEHFFLHKKVPIVLYRKKVFNYSELHFAEVTFYKIHTLEFSMYCTKCHSEISNCGTYLNFFDDQLSFHSMPSLPHSFKCCQTLN